MSIEQAMAAQDAYRVERKAAQIGRLLKIRAWDDCLRVIEECESHLRVVRGMVVACKDGDWQERNASRVPTETSEP